MIPIRLISMGYPLDQDRFPHDLLSQCFHRSRLLYLSSMYWYVSYSIVSGHRYSTIVRLDLDSTFLATISIIRVVRTVPATPRPIPPVGPCSEWRIATNYLNPTVHSDWQFVDEIPIQCAHPDTGRVVDKITMPLKNNQNSWRIWSHPIGPSIFRVRHKWVKWRPDSDPIQCFGSINPTWTNPPPNQNQSVPIDSWCWCCHLVW